MLGLNSSFSEARPLLHSLREVREFWVAHRKKVLELEIEAASGLAVRKKLCAYIVPRSHRSHSLHCSSLTCCRTEQLVEPVPRWAMSVSIPKYLAFYFYFFSN